MESIKYPLEDEPAWQRVAGTGVRVDEAQFATVLREANGKPRGGLRVNRAVVPEHETLIFDRRAAAPEAKYCGPILVLAPVDVDVLPAPVREPQTSSSRVRIPLDLQGFVLRPEDEMVEARAADECVPRNHRPRDSRRRVECAALQRSRDAPL